MPNNIELAISEALAADSSQTTPSITSVLSAYVKVAGFSDPNPTFSTSTSGCSSTLSAACSDAAVISAFERALEKAASSKTPGASEASKLVSTVRRHYWRGILIAVGSKEDELTQLLIEAERKEMGEEVPGLLLHTSTPNPAFSVTTQASDSPPSSPKKSKKKRRSLKDVTTTSAPNTTSFESSPPSPTDIATCEANSPPLSPRSVTAFSHELVITMAALVSPGVKALSVRRSEAQGALDNDRLPPLRTFQRYVKGEGYKTYYPCPCCGSGQVPAAQVIKALGLDGSCEGGGEDVHEERGHTKKKVIRKRKTSSTKGDDGKREKTRQVKRGAMLVAGTDQSKTVPFDPLAPSSSRVSM